MTASENWRNSLHNFTHHCFVVFFHIWFNNCKNWAKIMLDPPPGHALQLIPKRNHTFFLFIEKYPKNVQIKIIRKKNCISLSQTNIYTLLKQHGSVSVSNVEDHIHLKLQGLKDYRIKGLREILRCMYRITN